MAFFWSAARSAFFRTGIGTVPSDAVPVSDEVHTALFRAVADGASIETGQDGAPIAVYPPELTEEERLAARRAGMRCTRAQGIAVLGPEKWAQILAFADAPGTDWTVRTFIRESQEWRRLSPTIEMLGDLIDVTPEELDQLFDAATELTI